MTEERATILMNALGGLWVLVLLSMLALFMIAGSLSNILAELREFNHHRRLDRLRGPRA